MKQPLCLSSAPLAALLFGSVLVACHGPTTGALPDAACPHTSEFGNTGCFEVRGQVIGAAGQPLAGIFVGPKPASSPHPVPVPAVFNTTNVPTDAAGQFRVRLARMFGTAAGGGGPDTLSVYVVAVDRSSAGIGVPPRIRDSGLVVVTVAPAGAVPTPVKVRITLPVPRVDAGSLLPNDSLQLTFALWYRALRARVLFGSAAAELGVRQPSIPFILRRNDQVDSHWRA